MSTRQFAKPENQRGLRRFTTCLLLAGAAFLLPSGTAVADPFPVTNTADSGEGTLRAAIEAADLHAGLDSIPIGAAGTIELESPLPVIQEAVDIAGPGQTALTVRRKATSDFRIFESDPVALSLSGMTVANGRAHEGAGILAHGALTLTEVTVKGNEAVASGEAEAAAKGGGVLSVGPLTMRETTVSGNTAVASGGAFGSKAGGGGVVALGGSLIERSTVSGNTAEATAAGVSEFATASGGGLLLGGEGLNRVQRSTVSGNSATASGGISGTAAFGGGIEGEDLTITGSTITADLATPPPPLGAGANLAVRQDTLVRDTIVSNPLGGAPNCGGPLISEGFNIDDDSDCGFTEPTDHPGVNPGLNPSLAANGGPTRTHALLPGSVAIDAGSAFGAATDQRGLPRPSDFAAIPNPLGGDGSDIGAFEVQVPMADTTAPDTRIDREPPRRTRKRLARFSFSSTEPGSRFECKLDDEPFRACDSPLTRRVRRGVTHAFEVRATDMAGNVDPTPAKCVWRVKRPRPPTGRAM